MKQGRRTMPDPAMASESERIMDLYQQHATDWDKERGRDLFEKPWLDRFLALLPPGASVLDIGCGAGEPIARYLDREGLPGDRHRLLASPHRHVQGPFS